MFSLFLSLVIVFLGYRISIWFLLYFPSICWKSRCCFYFIVPIKHDYFNVIFWQLHYPNPLWFVSAIYCLSWFRITLFYLLMCLVSFDWVVDIVYKNHRSNFRPRIMLFSSTENLLCLCQVPGENHSERTTIRFRHWDHLKLATVSVSLFVSILLAHSYPRVQPLHLNSCSESMVISIYHLASPWCHTSLMIFSPMGLSKLLPNFSDHQSPSR